MPLHGFALRKEYEDLDPNTEIALPEGRPYKVGKAFADAKDGIVVLDDQDPDQVPVIQTLDAYFAVKSAAVPSDVQKAHDDAVKAAAEAERKAAEEAAKKAEKSAGNQPNGRKEG